MVLLSCVLSGTAASRCQRDDCLGVIPRDSRELGDTMSSNFFGPVLAFSIPANNPPAFRSARSLISDASFMASRLSPTARMYTRMASAGFYLFNFNSCFQFLPLISSSEPVRCKTGLIGLRLTHFRGRCVI
jgi:hypothetical protein